MNRNDRIVRMARDLRQLIKDEDDKVRLKKYEEVALALSCLLDELGDAGIIGTDVGLELNEYSQLKSDAASVAEQYGESVDAGLEKYRPDEPK